tara:strand:+ start:48 stop:317 length:270 start_codon:yes stop_codon:yes gene_type:complete
MTTTVALPEWIANLQVGEPEEAPSSEPMAQAQFLQRIALRTLEVRARAEEDRQRLGEVRRHLDASHAELAAQQERIMKLNAAVMEKDQQ